MKQDLVARFQRWVIVAIVLCCLLYLAGSVWSGLTDIQTELSEFRWSMFGAAILLTLVNYTLRFIKWHFLLGCLAVNLDWQRDAWNFTAGLSMAISPGKAGELLKPYVVKQLTGTAKSTTIPALITERLTDGIAMLLLAAAGVITYAADKWEYLAIPAVVTILGLMALSNERLSLWALSIIDRLPVISKLSPKFRELIRAMRICVAPLPLLWTIALSIVAWGAECYAYLLIFKGLGVDASISVSFFIYAFATVAGSAMPGGLGVADGALVGGALRFIPGLTRSKAVTAAILVRIATLWFGVLIGAVALLKISSWLGESTEIEEQTETVQKDG